MISTPMTDTSDNLLSLPEKKKKVFRKSINKRRKKNENDNRC